MKTPKTKKRPKNARHTGKSMNYDLFYGNKKGPSAFNGATAWKLYNPDKIPPVKLPTLDTLQHLFNRFNNIYFDGKLKKVRIEYSFRMTCAGSYCPDDKTIKLSAKYHQLFPAELEDTLKHEMIHIKHFFHDRAFKAEARRIGASLKAKSHPLLQKPPKFLYVCPGCGQEYPRQKKMAKHSCGDCSVNREYDPRYRLVLKKLH
jgi:predicted SprT family Zn-dependent metalloprotease